MRCTFFFGKPVTGVIIGPLIRILGTLVRILGTLTRIIGIRIACATHAMRSTFFFLLKPVTSVNVRNAAAIANSANVSTISPESYSEYLKPGGPAHHTRPPGRACAGERSPDQRRPYSPNVPKAEMRRFRVARVQHHSSNERRPIYGHFWSRLEPAAVQTCERRTCASNISPHTRIACARVGEYPVSTRRVPVERVPGECSPLPPAPPRCVRAMNAQ
jgi:hypothetical protein